MECKLSVAKQSNKNKLKFRGIHLRNQLKFRLRYFNEGYILLSVKREMSKQAVIAPIEMSATEAEDSRQLRQEISIAVGDTVDAGIAFAWTCPRLHSWTFATRMPDRNGNANSSRFLLPDSRKI